MKLHYTKGDCYALCEILDALLMDHKDTIKSIADDTGYEARHVTELLERLDLGIDKIIATEQAENDYTEQMAEIMELKHIKG